MHKKPSAKSINQGYNGNQIKMKLQQITKLSETTSAERAKRKYANHAKRKVKDKIISFVFFSLTEVTHF